MSASALDVNTKDVTSAAKTTKRKATKFHANPKKAGWLTKIVLGVLCVMWLVPVLGTVLTSFRPIDDVNNTGWWSLFTNPKLIGNMSFANYSTVLNTNGMGQAFINSFAITLPATFIPILVASFAAYTFTFMEFKGRDPLFLIIVSLLVVPNYVAFVPLLKMYKTVGLSGTFPAVWLAHIGFGLSLAIYIFRNYMSTLPRTVIESAKVDGASHFQTFFRLVLPMSVPAIASFAIFQFLWVWNDLLVAIVINGPGEKAPLTVSLANMTTQQGGGWELVTAGGLLSMIVPLIVFFSLQRYFVRGLTAGAVKG